MITLTASLPSPFHNSHPNSMPPPTSTSPSRKRKLVPLASSPSISDSSSEQDRDRDGEYDPGPSTRLSHGGGAKRARPPAQMLAQGTAVMRPAKGMSREALRKANHSLIERRRREKINHALGELRDMVPGLGEAGGGKGGEFKLEVLERTVIHMKHLKSHILNLEAKLAESSSSSEGSSSVPLACRTLLTNPVPGAIPRTTTTSTPTRKRTTPPSPSSSLDPNETDLESNLPPALTLASRPTVPSFPPDPVSREHSPSITSLLASIPDRPSLPLPNSRPEASAQAYNPTLYLPFPTPSPTSPFLTYSHGGSTASSSLGPPEPSPFLAPLQGMPLFGGALSLDHVLAPSPKDALGAGAGAGTDIELKGRGGGEKEHEAANVLLAFSSPDVMRPSLGMTPMVQAHKGVQGGTRERRGTLDSEEFVLDGGTGSGSGGGQGGKKRDEVDEREVRGKTAREILRM